jgi:hypothetical protein
MSTINKMREVFGIFHDKESFFSKTEKKEAGRMLVRQVLIICLMGFLYGLVMGGFHSFIQALVAGVKIVVLFIATLAICFPSFYIIQQVLGSRMSFSQMMIIILSGFILSFTITLSFAPIIVFFLVTGNNYHFLQLLHVSVFIFSGIFGIRLIIEALKYACEIKSIYPQIGVTVFRIWIVIFAFVGIQLAWNLRPFLGDKKDDFELFREYEGNFYTAIIYSFNQLSSGNNNSNDTESGGVNGEDTSQLKTPELIEKINKKQER